MESSLYAQTGSGPCIPGESVKGKLRLIVEAMKSCVNSVSKEISSTTRELVTSIANTDMSNEGIPLVPATANAPVTSTNLRGCVRGRVLVTGGAGFIGSHLVQSLLERQGSIISVITERGGGSGEFTLIPDLAASCMHITSVTVPVTLHWNKTAGATVVVGVSGDAVTLGPNGRVHYAGRYGSDYGGDDHVWEGVNGIGTSAHLGRPVGANVADAGDAVTMATARRYRSGGGGDHAWDTVNGIGVSTGIGIPVTRYSVGYGGGDHAWEGVNGIGVPVGRYSGGGGTIMTGMPSTVSVHLLLRL